MRPTIDIDDSGIFLRWIEIDRFYQAVVEVGHSISSLKRAHSHLGHIESRPRIGSIQQDIAALAILHTHQFDATRSHRSRITVNHPVGRSGELHRVHAFAIAYRTTLAALHIHGIEVALQGAYFGADNDDLLALFVEADNLLHQPFTLSQLSQFLSLHIV